MTRCWLLVRHSKNVSGSNLCLLMCVRGSCPLWGRNDISLFWGRNDISLCTHLYWTFALSDICISGHLGESYPCWKERTTILCATLFTHSPTSRFNDSMSQAREPVSTLDDKITPRTFSLITNPSLFLDRAALHLNLRPYHSFRLTYRNCTTRRSKSGVYAEVVRRKCGERITEERKPHLDARTTPVGLLFPQYVHSIVNVRV